jgi:hypothetical protein
VAERDNAVLKAKLANGSTERVAQKLRKDFDSLTIQAEKDRYTIESSKTEHDKVAECFWAEIKSFKSKMLSSRRKSISTRRMAE